MPLIKQKLNNIMNANELRIGNLVNFENDVISVTSGDINYFDENLDSFDPIPITPDLLLKCGFTKSRSHSLDYFYDAGGLTIISLRLGKPFWHNNNALPEKKYLHELQNLIFALTGQELNIKL